MSGAPIRCHYRPFPDHPVVKVDVLPSPLVVHDIADPSTVTVRVEHSPGWTDLPLDGR